MVKDKLSLKNKQLFIKLCLLLLPEYRSGQFHSNKVVFWKKRFSLLHSRVTFSTEELLFYYIPLQLSYGIWGTRSLYTGTYQSTLKNIFKNNILDEKTFIQYIGWMKGELEKCLVTDISNPLIRTYAIEFNHISEKDVYKTEVRVLKISLKEDVIDPTIIKIKTLNLLKKSTNIKTFILPIAASVILNLGLWFRNITFHLDKEICLTHRGVKVISENIHFPKQCSNSFTVTSEVIAQHYQDSS